MHVLVYFRDDSHVKQVTCLLQTTITAGKIGKCQVAPIQMEKLICF